MLEKVRSAVEIVKKPCYQERMRDPNNAFYMYIRKRIEEDMPEPLSHCGISFDDAYGSYDDPTSVFSNITICRGLSCDPIQSIPSTENTLST
mmetsp:Transcript_31041/g.26515  ORF Transcript_31041/g.26515 Transcript_31041/m.26515 type:complete len:92 (+) Transcript_31041:113-388(+)